MDIATLGLRIVNDAAVRALDITSAKLDAMGASADKASAKVAATGSAAKAASTEYARLSDQDLANAVKQFDAMYGSAGKAAKATTEAAVAGELLATKTEASVGGIARLRQSFASLAAQATGTSPILDRISGTLGAFALGNVEMVAILAGIAAVGAAWHAMSHGMSDDAQYAEDAIKRLRQEIVKAKDAMGTVTLAAARANLNTAQQALDEARQKAGGRDQTPGSFGAMVSQSDVEAAQKAVTAAQGVYTQALNDQKHAQAEGLAELIRSNNLTADERKRAISQLKADQAEMRGLLGKSDDKSMDRRLTLNGEITSLTDALFPKKEALADARDRAAQWKALLNDANATTRSLLAQIAKAPHDKVLGMWTAFGLADPTTTKTISEGAKKELGMGTRGNALLDPLRDIVDQGTVMQARIDIENARRAAHGEKPIDEGQGTAMDTVRRSAVDMGETLKQKVEAANLPLATQKQLLEDIAKLLKEIGANAPRDKGPGGWQQAAGQTASWLRTGADAANLFGGAKGAQIGNLLNTAANATENVTAAAAQGFTNPLTDAKAILSVASLGKQVFGLGKQSHDAARQVREASEAVNNMLDQLAASVNHDALGSLLAQAQAAYDAQKKQINDDLSGKKREKERNADLARLDELYAQQKQQITEQYGKQQVLDEESLQARLLRAKGLTYQADMADLAVKQQEEYNQAILDGRDATYMATLAQVQLAEKTALANQEITQLAHAPTGFFAERYFGAYAVPANIPSVSGSGAGTASGGNQTTITGPITVAINGNRDGATMLHDFVTALRAQAMATVGAGGSLASALEYVN